MEFDFDCAQVLGADASGIAVIDGTSSLKRGPQHYSSGAQTHPYQKLLNEIVDSVGEASAYAQSLTVSVTTSLKFFASSDRLYLLVEGFKVLGMLKVGTRKLFIRDEIGNIKEIEPLCVLDFYVHESCQRAGFGKYIFECMLDNDKVEPHKIAYDRPSDKLIKFLKKYYGLENYIPQANNYVVFNSYFIHDKSFRAYAKDPIKSREKIEAPKKEVQNDNYDSYNSHQDAYGGYPQQTADNHLSGKMPSYKEAMSMRNQAPAEDRSFEPKCSSYMPTGAYPDEHNYGGKPDFQNEQKDFTDTSQRRVHFSDNQPEVYQPQEYEEQENDHENTAPYPSDNNNNYMGYDGYQAPAGRNYMNPNIEEDQFQRKFNRTTGKFESNETVKDLFPHPEGEGPLDSYDPRKQQIPVEYEMKKTNQRISDTESELKKCEERLKQLEMKSTELHRTSQAFNKEKFLGEEKKQIYSTEKDVIKPDLMTSAYNKRFGYATVYDNKYKSVAKDPSILENDRPGSYGSTSKGASFASKSVISNAGSNLLAQNPNMNVYQHQQLLRTTPFGASTGGSAYSKMTSSSAYGNFFKK